jgi:hypothetical protein
VGDLNIKRPTTRPDSVPLSSVRDIGTAASFLSLEGTNPVDDGDSGETRRHTLVWSVVGHRESDGRDAWAAVPIMLIARSADQTPVAQASIVSSDVCRKADIIDAMRVSSCPPERQQCRNGNDVTK